MLLEKQIFGSINIMRFAAVGDLTLPGAQDRGKGTTQKVKEAEAQGKERRGGRGREEKAMGVVFGGRW